MRAASKKSVDTTQAPAAMAASTLATRLSLGATTCVVLSSHLHQREDLLFPWVEKLLHHVTACDATTCAALSFHLYLPEKGLVLHRRKKL